MTRARQTADAGGGANPAYVNARVRARRAALLDEGDYRKLIRMGPHDIARFLEETEYGEEMNTLGTRYSGVDLVEFALVENLSRHFHDLLRWADGRLYEDIARYLRKFDAWNIKTALRGIYTGSDPAEVERDLILGGELTERQIEAMLEASTIEGVIEAVSGTIFEAPLRDALDDYTDSGLLIPLENAIDRAFYSFLATDLNVEGPVDTRAATAQRLAADSPADLYREFLTAEIDFLNVRNALRIARSRADIDPSTYYIEGGRLFRPATLARLVTDIDDLILTIEESVYGEELGDALDAFREADTLLEFELAIDKALVAYGDWLGSRYPVSICPIISYVLAKELEVQNIRAIARGREAGLDEEEIREELVIL